MAFLDFTVTLTGASQQLLTAARGASAGTNEDRGLKVIILQPDGGNANPVYVGGAPGTALSSTLHGFSLPAASGGVPPAPFVLGEFAGEGPLKLSGFWVLGTAAQKLHVAILEV